MKTIQLSQGQVALVDDADFDDLSRFKWTAQWIYGTFYAVRRCKHTRKYLYMHRQIVVGTCQHVDHRNGNGLDNQRANLRAATSSQNHANMKTHRGRRFKGVRFDNRRDHWTASITVNYKQKYLGSYETEEAAARAYDDGARAIFGEFCRPNFPAEKELVA